MALSKKVTIRYGPYEANGVVDYRTWRLIGLQTMLDVDGHQWVLEQSPDWNVVELVVRGEIVYTCDIKDLDFDAAAPVDFLQPFVYPPSGVLHLEYYIWSPSFKKLNTGGDGKLDPLCKAAVKAVRHAY